MLNATLGAWEKLSTSPNFSKRINTLDPAVRKYSANKKDSLMPLCWDKVVKSTHWARQTIDIWVPAMFTTIRVNNWTPRTWVIEWLCIHFLWWAASVTKLSIQPGFCRFSGKVSQPGNSSWTWIDVWVLSTQNLLAVFVAVVLVHQRLRIALNSHPPSPQPILLPPPPRPS